MDRLSQLPVVIGRDVASLSRVESDLTDFDPSMIPSYDPPATYTRSPSFHESEVGSLKRNIPETTATSGLANTCQPSSVCNPVQFLEKFMAFANESTEKCPSMALLTDEGSQSDSNCDHSKGSVGEDLLIECNKSQRGRFLVWPAST